MATLVNVRTAEGQDVVINLDQVVSIEPHEQGSVVYFVDQRSVRAVLPPIQVAALKRIEQFVAR